MVIGCGVWGVIACASLRAEPAAARPIRIWNVDPRTLGSIERYVEPAADVRDPVLAFLVGLLRDDVSDTLARDAITDVTARSSRSTLIPLERLVRMGRGRTDSTGQYMVTVWLDRDSSIPAPYSLLGYHPGSVLIPQRVVLREWELGRVVITERNKGSFSIDGCYLWAVEEGAVAIDIDGVVDNLLGGSVDDMRVTTLALFSLEGTRYAMGMGYNAHGKGRSGALNLVRNELEFPSSWKLKSAGKLLRRKAERLGGKESSREGGS